MHHYRNLPDSSFWRRAVAEVSLAAFDPVVDAPFKLTRKDRVTAAGSCFAQHISRHLLANGFNVVVTERPSDLEMEAGAQTIYSARYGNIYTTRQLLQLGRRAYGLAEPVDVAWVRPDGRYVDPYRPEEFKSGFATVTDMMAERERHYANVRAAIETASIFVFTLGLTEAWISDADGFAVPVAPSVVAESTSGQTYSPVNLSVTEMVDDLTKFINLVRSVSPEMKFIFTVSPVPLIATFEPRHVLVSTVYSKAALRVVAEEVTKGASDALYFPSYEIIAGHPLASYFAEDLRSVTPAGVSKVMTVFERHLLDRSEQVEQPLEASSSTKRPDGSASAAAGNNTSRMDELEGVVCEEELNERFA